MTKKKLLISAFCLLVTSLLFRSVHVNASCGNFSTNKRLPKSRWSLLTDSLPPPDVMDVISTAIYATNDFNIDAVANLYTPNAIIADDEPPYSWNGPTAGVQWINAVEMACRENKISKLKGSIELVTVFQQNGDNIYVVVPVSYTGNLPGKRHYAANGAFNFVLRLINGKWMIKSQTWISKKGFQ